MPKEASKRSGWEKERRNRIQKSFDELSKVLPSYVPSIKISKIEILDQAKYAILGLKEELNTLSTPNEENKAIYDERIKKLQDRVKKLVLRNEQLTNLFKDAGINLPKVCSSVKDFKKRQIWSNRVYKQRAKVEQRREMEKENVSSLTPRTSAPQNNVKRVKVDTNTEKRPRNNKNLIKIHKPKKSNQNVPTSNNLLVLSQMPPMPAINPPLVLVPNAPLHNISRGATLVRVPSTKTRKSKKPTTAPINLGSSTLGPGTLILGNGNIISLLPQPQIIIPPLTVPSQTIVFSKVIKKQGANPPSNNSGIRKNDSIRPKRCVTNTTQINKVPIPALTSKYASTSLLLQKSVTENKQSKTNKGSMVKSSKRKADVENESQSKKSKTVVTDETRTVSVTDATAVEVASKVEVNKDGSANDNGKSKDFEEVIEKTQPIIPINSNIPENKTESLPPETSIDKEDTNQINENETNYEKETTPENILDKVEPPIDTSTGIEKETPEKFRDSNSDIPTTSNETQPPSKNTSEITSSTTLSEPTSTSVTSNMNTSVNEDTMKNLDLNLVHSDLSNDIFASLQVPPGCQNTESTSPTAAFLLAFPLVSSIKVTEVIDEENSNSQRETPTLLQIGSMDTCKPSHNDNILNLEHFPFFNSKDMCTSYYSSKEGNIESDKNPEGKSIDLPSENSKLESETFNAFPDDKQLSKDLLSSSTNTFKVYELFQKSQSNDILENKTTLNKSHSKLEDVASSTNNVPNVVSDDQYIIYADKNKQDIPNIFHQNESGSTNLKNFQESRNDLLQLVQGKDVSKRRTSNATFEGIADKLETSCIGLPNDISTNNYNIPQGNSIHHPLSSASNTFDLSGNIVYKNFNEKNVHLPVRKQLNIQENSSNQYIFRNPNNAKEVSSNEFNSNPKIAPSPIKEHNLNMPCNNFSLNEVKESELTNRDLETCNKSSTNKMRDTYQYNPFEIRTVKEISSNLPDSSNRVTNDVDKDRQTMKATERTKRMDEIAKSAQIKSPCYFSSNYSSSSCTSNYKSDSSKVCPSCTYENQRNHSAPFYTNCNYSYNYADTNNQNYYKPDAKSCYSLNYENYQDYRKTDSTVGNTINFTKDKRHNTTKDKQSTQNKPVNWMTTEQKSQTSDCFLPSFTNQSYSFTSCITTDTADATNITDTKKPDLLDKRFSWSPTKLPNFLEPTHNFITPTLPTLVGDLALGNSLPINETKMDYKYSKETKRKTYDNQANFLSVSQLVNQNKTDNVPARTISRRPSGSKSKSMTPTKNKRFDKIVDKNTVKSVNNYDIFYDQKTKSSIKNVISNYSAEALIGHQEAKKCTDNSAKVMCPSNFLSDNVVPYFTTVDDGFMNQNQNYSNSFTHNSFQNNSYAANSFIYTAPPISSSYLTSNIDGTTHDYSTENAMNYCGFKDNKNCSSKNYKMINNKDDKNQSYSSTVKKAKRINQITNNSLGNFDYPILSMQGSTNSPILPDDFQSHTTFLPPTAPYACKNSLYQKQGNEFNTGPLLPLPGITRNNAQHPQVSPSLNPVGTSLTNFNLSTIFPEINKGNIPNVHSDSGKSKNNPNFMEGSFNSDSKYGFSG